MIIKPLEEGTACAVSTLCRAFSPVGWTHHQMQLQPVSYGPRDSSWLSAQGTGANDVILAGLCSFLDKELLIDPLWDFKEGCN